MTTPILSVVIPVYNEKENIAPSVERILMEFGPVGKQCEILFVDDNSPDGTAEEVERIARLTPQVRLVQHGKKEGIGAAHHAGYHAAKGEYILCIDVDLSQSPSDLLKMKQLLDAGYDLVVGSRYLPGAKQVGKSLSRDWGSKGMNWIARVFLGIPLTDSTHTFRVFRKSLHDALCSQLDQKGHPSFQIQFSFWAARRGFRLSEVAIQFVERSADRGQSKLSIRRELPLFLRLVGRLMFIRMARVLPFMTVLFVFLSLRLIGIGNPILGTAPTRQADNAQVARNYYLHHNPFLLAELDVDGAKPIYQLLELPIIPYAVSILYRIFGGVHEWIYRLVTLLFSLATFLMLYQFVKLVYDRTTAVAAIIAYCLSPLEIILAKSLLIESVLLCFSLSSIFFLYRWIFFQSRTSYWVSCFSLAIAILLKPYSMYLFLPAAYLFYLKNGALFLRQISFWFLISFCMGTFIFYLACQNQLITAGMPTLYTISSMLENSLQLIGTPSAIPARAFVNRLYSIFTQDMLTPMMFLPLLTGVFIKIHSRTKGLFHLWLLAVAVYFLISPYVITFHGYYSLPALLPCSVFIGVGAKQMIQGGLFKNKKIFYKKTGVVFLGLSALACTLREAGASYLTTPEQKALVEAGRRVNQLVEKDAVVIACAKGISPTSLLYYANRKGFVTKDATVGLIEEDIKKGAQYFVTVAPEMVEDKQELGQYLYKRHGLVEREAGYVIFRLKKM